MIKAITRMAADCWNAKVGFADMMALIRREFPTATREEIETGVSEMVRSPKVRP